MVRRRRIYAAYCFIDTAGAHHKAYLRQVFSTLVRRVTINLLMAKIIWQLMSLPYHIRAPVAPVKRFELLTHGLEIRCSVQLS